MASVACNAPGRSPKAKLGRTRRPPRRHPHGTDAMQRRTAAQQQGQRQHRHGAEHGDTEMRLPPADRGDEMLHHGRPERAGDIVAGGADRHRDAAAPVEPVRHVGQQRHERGRASEQSDQQAIGQGELPERRGEARGEVTQQQRNRAAQHRRHHAEPVRHAPQQHAAEREADHAERERQRRVAAGDAELHLRGRQRGDHRPHADAADAGQQQRNREAEPGIAPSRSGCRVQESGYASFRTQRTLFKNQRTRNQEPRSRR